MVLLMNYYGGSRLSWLVHVMAVASAVMVIVWCLCFRGGLALSSPNKGLIFNLHPLLLLIGFVIVGGEALVMYRCIPTDLSPGTKLIMKAVHAALHTTALLFGVLGVCVAFKYHVESGTGNMYSLHSWLGMTILVLYAVQWTHGFLVFLYPGFLSNLSTRRNKSLNCHVKLGLAIFILAIGNAVIGFVQKLTGLSNLRSESLLINFTAIATMMFGIFVVLTAIPPRPVQTDEYLFCGYEPLISQC